MLILALKQSNRLKRLDELLGVLNRFINRPGDTSDKASIKTVAASDPHPFDESPKDPNPSVAVCCYDFHHSLVLACVCIVKESYLVARSHRPSRSLLFQFQRKIGVGVSKAKRRLCFVLYESGVDGCLWGVECSHGAILFA